MTRAVVFLTATLLLASLGAVAQTNSNPSGGHSASAQASAPTQNATQPPAPPSSAPVAATASGTTTNSQSKSIQESTQGTDPRTTSSAELPQTSTILPLLGLLGLGSLVAGLFARR